MIIQLSMLFIVVHLDNLIEIFSFSFSIMQLFNQVFLNTFASNERLTRLTHDQ
jgi:hypothetical protein